MLSLNSLDTRLKQIENSINSIGYEVDNAITSRANAKSRSEVKETSNFGMYLCLCVSTDDPLAAGRIRIFHPVQDETTALPEQLRWAEPISPFGGFDDSGATWVPPAGSMVAIVFLNGDANTPFYLGTAWTRRRGADGQHTPYFFNYPYMDEYRDLYDYRRGGYNFGDNNGDQVLPPWNTSSYNQYDWDETETFYQFESDLNNATVPNYYGVKTNGKQWLKFVDGDPRCNYKGKRTELATARGNCVIMKDDHLHDFTQLGYNAFSDVRPCDVENPCCDGVPSPFDPIVGCPPPEQDGCAKQSGTGAYAGVTTPDSPFQKRKEENKLYEGVNTPAANKVYLPQSGVYIGSCGGAFIAMDDSVSQPSGVPDWQLDFNFGCENKFQGGLVIGEQTGHFVRMSGYESNPQIRDKTNGIFLSTAMGNKISVSDHTEQSGGSCNCPPNQLGEDNGIRMKTITKHELILSNEGAKKCSSEPRKYSPVSELEDSSGYGGYCMLRSGYGLRLLMKDAEIQTETDQQFIMLESPQTDNDRGPHMLIMQEQPQGDPGYVFLRAGGVLHLSSRDEMLEVVGEETEGNEASKFVSVTDSYMVQVKNYYFNHNKSTFMWADDIMYLIAGNFCDIPENNDDVTNQELTSIQGAANGTTGPRKFPCLHNAITSKDPWACPLTGYVHFGVELDDGGEPLRDSRSKTVILSAGEDEEGTDA